MAVKPSLNPTSSPAPEVSVPRHGREPIRNAQPELSPMGLSLLGRRSGTAELADLRRPRKTTDPPPAVPIWPITPAGSMDGDGATDWRPLLHPSIPLRFTDVVEELRTIASLASAAVEVEGSRLARACLRAESLLRVLRAQFLQDVVALDGGSGSPVNG